MHAFERECINLSTCTDHLGGEQRPSWRDVFGVPLTRPSSRGGSRENFLGWYEGGKKIKWGGKIKTFFSNTYAGG